MEKNILLNLIKGTLQVKSLVLGIGVGALLLTSCAQDGYEDETFNSGVFGAQLENPSVDDITIKASDTNDMTIISWPVVYGASGYECQVLDVTDEVAPVVLLDSLVDGCTVTVPRAEETNYQLSLKVIGNKKNNNQDAPAATVIAFNTFVASFATIPAGTDLYAYFANNEIPEEAVYDLEAGGNYTVSDALDFGCHKVTLRTANKQNHAKIKYTNGNSALIFGDSFGLKYIDFDCSASEVPAFQLSKEPNEAIKGIVSGDNAYYDFKDPSTISGCNIEGVNDKIIYDNKQKYGLGALVIQDCVIHLTTIKDLDNGFDFYGGGVVSFTMKNSTMYNTGNGNISYLLRYSNNARCDRMGYTTNNITYENCTFYNVAKTGQWGNYSGLNSRNTSNFIMTSNIFVDCSSNAVARRFVGGNVGNSIATFKNNTYMYDGAFEENEAYDQSGTQVKSNPQFRAPQNGDFTVGGPDQIALGMGDPRWLP